MTILEPRTAWSQRLAAYLPAFLAEHPVLAPFGAQASLLLHGSTCRDMDDAFSDLDVFFLLSNADLARLDAASSSRFFALQVEGKAGHLNAASVADLAERVQRCDLPLIAELRMGVLIEDRAGGVAELLARARQPMRPEVSQAYFFFHYMQMRQHHRAADNPMERGDPVAVLLAVSQTLAHALCAALALDGEPHPYEKWLYRTAVQHPTGRQLAPAVEELLDRLADNALRLAGPQAVNPLSLLLRRIRQILVDAAQAHGIQADWLTRWWLQIDQMEESVKRVRW
jgi:hypothetical protein